LKPGKILGHEPMGVVHETGDGVQLVKSRDSCYNAKYCCGSCLNCIQVLINECLTLNPDAPGATYGTSKGL
jgi:glutathione-independent formaldehyde dehydrogenase